MPINPQTALQSLSTYPPWLVIACAVLTLASVLWIALKLLKWSIVICVIAALVLAGAAAVWLLCA